MHIAVPLQEKAKHRKKIIDNFSVIKSISIASGIYGVIDKDDAHAAMHDLFRTAKIKSGEIWSNGFIALGSVGCEMQDFGDIICIYKHMLLQKGQSGKFISSFKEMVIKSFIEGSLKAHHHLFSGWQLAAYFKDCCEVKILCGVNNAGGIWYVENHKKLFFGSQRMLSTDCHRYISPGNEMHFNLLDY